MLFKKKAVSYDNKPAIDYLAEIEKRAMPKVLFISGAENNIFPGSNKTTFEHLLKTKHAGQVSYQEFSNYGHQDVFMGQYCHTEVFPHFIKFMKENEA
ncbi:hypothetical protein D3C72_1339410 [compost metagenome]